MKIFNFVLTQSSSNVIVKWCTDVDSDCVVRYSKTPVGSEITTTSSINVNDTTGTETISGLAIGDEYKFQIIGKAKTGELVSSQWKYITLTASQAIVEEGVSVDRSLIPLSSKYGDNISRKFPEWMAISKTPGTLLYDCENAAGSTKLYFDSIPEVTVGMIAFKYDDLSTMYNVIESPASIAIISTSRTYNVLTIDPDDVADLEHVTELSKCWMIDMPTQIYFVVSVAGDKVTIDRDPGDCSGVTWLFEQKAVILDKEVTDENVSTKWGFTTVARSIIDRSMLSLDSLMQYANETRNIYSPNRINESLPWLGHISRIPTQNVNVDTEVVVNRYSDTVAEFSNSAAATFVPLLKVNTIYDLLYTPAPTYMISSDTVLFNQLTMLEEVFDNVVANQDGLLEVELDNPVVINTKSRTDRSYSELPIYIYDYVYGWEKLDENSYYIIPNLNTQKATLVLNDSRTTQPIKVRYCAAKSWEDPYGLFVNIAVNGVKQASMPTIKTLWNQLDEIGLMIGIKRLENESNHLFKTRLIAAANIDPTPTKQNFISLLGTRLGSITYNIWDTSQELSLPENTECVFVKEFEELVYLENEPMLRDLKSTSHRLYLRHIPEGDVTIYINGNATDKQLETDGLNTDSTQYVTLSPVEWNSNITVTANYAIRMYTLELDENGYKVSVVPTEYAKATSFVAHVFSTQDITTTTFQDKAFRRTLVDGYNIANSTYRQMASTLVNESKIITDNAEWGVTPWFYRSNANGNPQFTMLPLEWD